jgi:hypothetical protein
MMKKKERKRNRKEKKTRENISLCFSIIETSVFSLAFNFKWIRWIRKLRKQNFIVSVIPLAESETERGDIGERAIENAGVTLIFWKKIKPF